QFMVRQDLLDEGKVKGPADLKGRTIAAPAEQPEFYIERYLAKGNLTRDDVTLQRLNLADILAPVKNKAIDAACEVEPLATDAANWDPQQDYFLKRGIQKTRIDLGKYVDQAFVNNALQVLGRES